MPTLKVIKSLIAKGEGSDIEFKKSHASLSRSVFETICAFLNRNGGHIFLGVADNGAIEGIKTETLQDQLDVLAKDLNNPQIISPTFYIVTEVFEIEKKKIIYLYVPESSQPHSYKGVFYDRNREGDFRLTSQQLIANLYLRKMDSYTENRVFPYLRMTDFDAETFDTVRKYIRLEREDHPWLGMSNHEMLVAARMFLRDVHTGKEGYTLAAALLFGMENTLVAVLGHYKTDAICRKEDIDRYDDRDIINCNLIGAYTRLLKFIRKHLPDRFYLEGNRRLSIRDLIFREAIANILIHREFSHPYPAKLIIYKDTVFMENWNRPYMTGLINPDNLKPHPKNPVLANFFRQMGWMEELGSGIKKMFIYCPLYVKGSFPVVDEGDVFKLTIRYEKLAEMSKKKDHGAAPLRTIKHAEEVLILIRENPKITKQAIADRLAVSLSTVERAISKLIKNKDIRRSGARKKGEWQ